MDNLIKNYLRICEDVVENVINEMREALLLSFKDKEDIILQNINSFKDCLVKTKKKCEHGRRLYNCKDCGGKGICEHGKHRYYCVECGGNGICEHRRYRSDCKECKGSGICEHNKLRKDCIECDGTSICEHGRRRRTCNECGGSGICEHGKRRNVCKECVGSAICEHMRDRYTCKECGGSGICEHGNRKTDCVQCRGSSICEHNRQRSACKDCGGYNICEHGKYRQQCSECEGSSICKGHSVSLCGHRGNPKYDMYCTLCFRNLFPSDHRTSEIRTKSKEIQWVNALLQSPVLVDYNWVWDKPFYVSFEGGCCNSKRRIDLWVIIENVLFAIEIDEFQHKDRAIDYEDTRYNDLAMDFTGRQVFVRINPDSFKIDGVKQDISFDDRFKLVEKKIEDILVNITDEYDESSPLVRVHNMFYDN